MEQSIAAPPDAPDDSRSSPMQYSAALTMAKSLAKTSSDLHDTAKELNRQSPTSMIQNSSDADGTSEDIENSKRSPASSTASVEDSHPSNTSLPFI